MVYAEKIITALQRGTVNTRWRDFADIYVLSGRHPIDRADLRQALATVAAYRSVELAPLAGALDGYAALAQPRWAAWRRKQRLDDRLPESFASVLAGLINFGDPVLRRSGSDQTWDPDIRDWI